MMKFWVKLIEINETECGDSRDDLQANCTHVANNFWLFEGDESSLHDGIKFDVVGKEAIEAHGDLNSDQLKKMVRDIYNVDKCFLN